MEASHPGDIDARRSFFVPWVVDLAIIAIFVALAYFPLVFTHQSLPTDEKWSDLISLAMPTYQYTGAALAELRLPLWNPYWFSGYPHLAMPSAGVFYPTTILYGILPFALAVKIIAMLHAFLSGVFSYALIRHVIGGRISSLYFALITVIGDLVIVWIRNGQLWSLQTLTWFPLILLLVHRLSVSARLGTAAMLAVAMALMVFGGDPQAMAFCLWFLGPYTVVIFADRYWTDRANGRIYLQRLALCALGMVLGMAIASVQLIPSRELFSESIRAHGLTYRYLSISGFPELVKVFAWLMDTGDDHITITTSCRVVVALAVAGLVFSRNPAVWAAAAGSLLCLLYVLMPKWLYDGLIQYLPVFSGVRGAFRMCIILWWVVGYWSVFGLSIWVSKTRSHSQRRWFAAVIIVVLLIGIALPVWFRSPIGVVHCVAWGMATIGAAVVLVHGRIQKTWAGGVAMLMMALLMELGGFAFTSNVSSYTDAFAVNKDYGKYSTSRTKFDRVALLPPFHFRHGTSVGMITGDRTLMGYHGLLLSRFASVFRDAGGVPVAPMDERGKLEVQDFTRAAQLREYITDQTLPLLEIFNVRDIVVIAPHPVPELLTRRRDAFSVTAYGGIQVFTNPNALPPVFPIHEIIVCESDAEALALMRERKVDFSRQATITGDFNTDSVGPGIRPETLSITGYAPERISVTAELSAPAVLVFSEMYYPGWRATVDGAVRDVLPVNTALRGVHVEAGRHDVVLTYEPDSLKQGMAVSAGAMVVLAVLLVLAWRQSRRGSVTAPDSPA